MSRHRPIRLISAVTVLSFAAMSGCVLPSCGWPSLDCCCYNTHSMSIPDRLPLGSVNRAHYHTMQTNGEAGDFILYRCEFVDESCELTPFGKDHIAEIAARMPATPFPVIVQRSEYNANPELDDARRRLVAQILCDFGNADAANRTIVSQPYSNEQNSIEGQIDYYRMISTRGFGGGVGGGFGGGFGGGGGGGGLGF